MNRNVAVTTAIVVVAIAMLALTGCPKEEQAELQSAPMDMAPATGTHTMPDGQQMSDSQMPPAAEATSGAQPEDSTMASCPVLGTTMPKDKMLQYEHEGKTYYFCCQPCVEQFKADPQKWIDNPTPALPPAAGM